MKTCTHMWAVLPKPGACRTKQFGVHKGPLLGDRSGSKNALTAALCCAFYTIDVLNSVLHPFRWPRLCRTNRLIARQTHRWVSFHHKISIEQDWSSLWRRVAERLRISRSGLYATHSRMFNVKSGSFNQERREVLPIVRILLSHLQFTQNN